MFCDTLDLEKGIIVSREHNRTFTDSGISLSGVLLVCSILSGMALVNTAYATDVTRMVEPCFDCHGKNGVSTEAKVPTIAGYSEDYFTYSLDMYQKQDRPCVATEYPGGSKKGQKTDMCEIVKDMSEADIELMGKYFAKLAFVRSQQSFDAEMAKKGEAIHLEKCDECHGEAGGDPEDNAGLLGGQKMDYLREQIGFVRNGQRFTSKKMRLRLEALGESEMEAVVQYYGSIH